MANDGVAGSEADALLGHTRGETDIVAVGRNGQVRFDGTFVHITRNGIRARLAVGKGEKRIPITSIAAVQYKSPGPIVEGFIQFTIPGGIERRGHVGSRSEDAHNDENSVTLVKKQAAQFQTLRTAIEEAMIKGHRPGQSIVQPVTVSRLDQLKQIGELRTSGVLSDDEFDVEKARILAGS